MCCAPYLQGIWHSFEYSKNTKVDDRPYPLAQQPMFALMNISGDTGGVGH